jgi:D-tyrosyl-tRNA(Tyr) deacylase
MRVAVQRVTRARVTVGSETAGEIGPGMLLLVGVGREDNEETCCRMASKVARLRIFDDQAGKMNLSLLDTHGQALVVSQFTLYADTSRGLRPSFTNAEPARGKSCMSGSASEPSLPGCARMAGSAHMTVELVNDGPVTLLLDEPERSAASGYDRVERPGGILPLWNSRLSISARSTISFGADGEAPS